MNANIGIPRLPDVAGLSLDGSEPVVIDPAENRALCATMGVAPDPGGRAHPSYFYIATQVGMGLTVRALCQACDFDVSDGPMMATSGATFHAQLMTAQPYLVRGRIESLTRKQSRRLGWMDLLDYGLRLETPDGICAVETRNLWVLPRGAKPA
ncbi:MAG: hypothetical protein EOP60_07705 [Sphingomonadales bacterium]|nr:MAG: hypothetical protein EOP60_07705 [Sphingomonadales bacterium]